MQSGARSSLHTGCRTGPLWLDVSSPIRGERRHNLALRLWLVQELVVVRVALRDAFRRHDNVKHMRWVRSLPDRYADPQKHIPTSTPSRTKARNSRLGSIANHLRKTSSSLYAVGPEVPSPSTHPSKIESALRSCVTKSDDLRSKYTSAGDVHFKGEDEGKSQAASCIQFFRSSHGNEKKMERGLVPFSRTFGEEKLSFGNTAPYSLIAFRI